MDKRIINWVLVLASLAAMLVLYGLPSVGWIYYAMRVAAVMVPLGLLAWIVLPKLGQGLVAIWRNGAGFDCRLIVVTLASSVIALMLLGNMFVDNVIAQGMVNFLNHFGEGHAVESIGNYAGVDPIRYESGTWAIGDYRELEAWGQYNTNVQYFVCAYGVLLLMILMSQYYVWRGQRKKITLTLTDYLLYDIFIILVGLLPALFLFVDFVDYVYRSWIKTRFLEIPYYMIIFLFGYFVHRYAAQWQKYVVITFLIIYMVVPFYASGRDRQIRFNIQAYEQFLNS